MKKPKRKVKRVVLGVGYLSWTGGNCSHHHEVHSLVGVWNEGQCATRKRLKADGAYGERVRLVAEVL